MANDLKVLTIHHFGENSEDDARVALSPSTIKMISSRNIDKNGRSMKQTTVHFMDGEIITFTISGLELENLECVVAGYGEMF